MTSGETKSTSYRARHLIKFVPTKEALPVAQLPAKKCMQCVAITKPHGLSVFKNKTAPVRNKTAPVRNKTAPVRNKTAPVRNKTAPINSQQIARGKPKFTSWRVRHS